MNIHLGDFAEYVQQKVEREGYGSAAEVMREALRAMQKREREDAITQRLEAYILKGIDQGPPEGMSTEEWDTRLTATRERMNQFVMRGVEEAEQGNLIAATESRERTRKRLKI